MKDGSGGTDAVVSNITVSINESYYQTVTWTTSTAMTTGIFWSTDTSYSNSNTDGTLTTSHSIRMGVPANPLLQNTAYNFKVGNSGGTILSSNQTLTTRRLKVPALTFGPFSPLIGSAAFADTLTNLTGGPVNSSIGSPSVHNFNVDGDDLFVGSIDANMNLWGDTASIVFSGSILANGSNGEDGSNVCCTIYNGGSGGAGASGGGGGSGSSNSCCGSASGGPGGVAGSSGLAGNTNGPDSFAGSGAFGYGYEWDGANIGLSLIPQAAGNGGDTSGPGAGGGGGGSGKQIQMVINAFTNASSGSIQALGGSAGSSIGAMCCASPASAGENGDIVIFARKYDGSLGTYVATNIYMVEITGNAQAGFSYVVHAQGKTIDTWDHLYQP